MKITFSKSFHDFFVKLDPKIRKNIVKKIEMMSDDWESVDVKKMQPSHLDIYRLRIGKYRALFEKDADGIKFLKLDSRDKIYKK